MPGMSWIRLPNRKFVIALHLVSALLGIEMTIAFFGNWLGMVFLILTIYSVARLIRILVEVRNA